MIRQFLFTIIDSGRFNKRMKKIVKKKAEKDAKKIKE